MYPISKTIKSCFFRLKHAIFSSRYQRIIARWKNCQFSQVILYPPPTPRDCDYRNEETMKVIKEICGRILGWKKYTLCFYFPYWLQQRVCPPSLRQSQLFRQRKPSPQLKQNIRLFSARLKRLSHAHLSPLQIRTSENVTRLPANPSVWYWLGEKWRRHVDRANGRGYARASFASRPWQGRGFVNANRELIIGHLTCSKMDTWQTKHISSEPQTENGTWLNALQNRAGDQWD